MNPVSAVSIRPREAKLFLCKGDNTDCFELRFSDRVPGEFQGCATYGVALNVFNVQPMD